MFDNRPEFGPTDTDRSDQYRGKQGELHGAHRGVQGL
jgi:hypothetical protein